MSKGGPTEGWNPLADRIAVQARDFLDGVAALARGEGGEETVPLLLLEVSQILLAGAQLGASKDVILPDNWEPDVGADPDLDLLRSGLAKRLIDCDEYAELFDPYADTRLTSFRLSDDLAAVAADLIHGLQHYQAGRSLEALWWWQYSYVPCTPSWPTPCSTCPRRAPNRDPPGGPGLAIRLSREKIRRAFSPG
jgi:hypothetical protein